MLYCARADTFVHTASEDLKDYARAWIDKLSVKNGTYPPDSYPNPGNAKILLYQ